MIEAVRRKMIPVKITGVYQGMLEAEPLPYQETDEIILLPAKQRMPLALISV
jgi:hypothetical protein